uniref:Putative secreted peptide n=1 Tax=Anopheles braziliensis TaxID=58242 RepID=A0A2M3ZP50_9DIPT
MVCFFFLSFCCCISHSLSLFLSLSLWCARSWSHKTRTHARTRWTLIFGQREKSPEMSVLPPNLTVHSGGQVGKGAPHTAPPRAP